MLQRTKMTWISASFKGLTTQARNKVHAGTTTRIGGVSMDDYQGLNLASHVGDAINAVIQNRAIVSKQLKLPSEPIWLNQTHTNKIVELPQILTQTDEFDASFTKQNQLVCAVMTADCVPVVITDIHARFVATIHAGWRGLANGIVANSVAALLNQTDSDICEYTAWIGPAIGASAFEVGEEVKNIFRQKFVSSESYFTPHGNQKYLADLTGLVELALKAEGISYVVQSNLCTYSDPKLFYSYRRDGQTGRMATFAWLSS